MNNQVDDEELGYYVDPVLPRYRKGAGFREDNGSLSPWHKALINKYGEPFSTVLDENRNLEIRHLTEEEVQTVIHKQCDLQMNAISNAGENKIRRYLDREMDLLPEAIVPWYVKIRRLEHLENNRSIIEIATEYAEHNVKPCIFVTKSFIAEEDNRGKIVKMLNSLNVSDMFLWVDGMDKRETDPMTYASAADLVRKLSQEKISPHFFYGNYFSHLLAFLGNEGTTFGVAYQESKKEKTKNNTNQGGGDGTNRIYFQPVEEFLNFQQADEFGSEFDEDVCQCPVCQRDIGSWGDIYKFDSNYTSQRRHYIWTRYNHREQIHENSLEELLNELESSYVRYKDTLGTTSTVANPYHLRKWKIGIEHIVEKELEEDVGDFSDVERE